MTSPPPASLRLNPSNPRPRLGVEPEVSWTLGDMDGKNAGLRVLRRLDVAAHADLAFGRADLSMSEHAISKRHIARSPRSINDGTEENPTWDAQGYVGCDSDK